MSNRIFHLPSCPCRRARVLRQRIRREAKAIEAAANGAIGFIVPSRKMLLDDPDKLIPLLINIGPDDAPRNSMTSHTAAELRRLASVLVLAAEGVEALATERGC